MEKIYKCHIKLENWRAVWKETYGNWTWDKAVEITKKWADEECDRMNRTKPGIFHVDVCEQKWKSGKFFFMSFAVCEYNKAYRWIKLSAKE